MANRRYSESVDAFNMRHVYWRWKSVIPQYFFGVAEGAAGMGGLPIRDHQLQKINLNLIPVLRALLKDGSVSSAATALGRSPSAVSEALSQLRLVLGDQLFTRIGGRLQPTPRAAELAEPLEALYAQLEGFFAASVFEPEKSDRRFIVASSDALIARLGAVLVRTVRCQAPKMVIHFVDVGRGLAEQMAAREIDFALLPEFAIADLAPAPLKFQMMVEGTGMVVLANRNHPLANRSVVTRDDLVGFKQIRFRPDPVLLDKRKTMFMDGADPVDTAVFASQYLSIPHLLQGTDLIAIVPRPIGKIGALEYDQAVIDFSPIQKGGLGIAWSPVYDQDPAHQWLRREVVTAL